MSAKRENWGSKLGFLLAAAGSAIGLGSLWKFPYSMGDNGGGLFLICYIVFTFLIGVPIFIGELIIGRSTQKSPVAAYWSLSQQSPHWKIVGFLSSGVTLLILSYYAVVAGWGLNYSFMSLNHFTSGRSAEEIGQIFNVMLQSGDINLFYFLLFMLMTVGIVWGGINQGIEYYSKILTPALFIVLIGLTTYSMTLSGFKDAVHFMFYPDFTKLSSKGILEALGLAFYSVSVGMGIIITYGSYMSKQQDIPQLTGVLAFSSTFVSILAGLMIFPIVFSFGFTPSEGAGLVFKTMPVLFEKLPGTVILSTLFFLLVVLTALTSAISIFEVLVATCIDSFKMTRQRASLYLGLAVFVLGIPSALAGCKGIFPNWEYLYGKDFFTTMDYLCMNWIVPLNVLMTALFLGWKLDDKWSQREFCEGSKWGFLFKPWLYTTRWIVPSAILTILAHEVGII
ncbi:MAG: yhdH-A [Chlamydiales bacterium]|jgi:NSS family neurotransmitter:Na+ symporter|nr:yhdH-A [Chlamydiales bacterium]